MYCKCNHIAFHPQLKKTKYLNFFCKYLLHKSVDNIVMVESIFLELIWSYLCYVYLINKHFLNLHTLQMKNSFYRFYRKQIFLTA